jgi:hypothetical protein
MRITPMRNSILSRRRPALAIVGVAFRTLKCEMFLRRTQAASARHDAHWHTQYDSAFRLHRARCAGGRRIARACRSARGMAGSCRLRRLREQPSVAAAHASRRQGRTHARERRGAARCAVRGRSAPTSPVITKSAACRVRRDVLPTTRIRLSTRTIATKVEIAARSGAAGYRKTISTSSLVVTLT